MTKSALALIAECFTAEESREALSFETTIKEFSEFVEADVHYEPSVKELDNNFLRTRRYAD